MNYRISSWNIVEDQSGQGEKQIIAQTASKVCDFQSLSMAMLGAVEILETSFPYLKQARKVDKLEKTLLVSANVGICFYCIAVEDLKIPKILDIPQQSNGSINAHLKLVPPVGSRKVIPSAHRFRKNN